MQRREDALWASSCLGTERTERTERAERAERAERTECAECAECAERAAWRRVFRPAPTGVKGCDCSLHTAPPFPGVGLVLQAVGAVHLTAQLFAQMCARGPRFG